MPESFGPVILVRPSDVLIFQPWRSPTLNPGPVSSVYPSSTGEASALGAGLSVAASGLAAGASDPIDENSTSTATAAATAPTAAAISSGVGRPSRTHALPVSSGLRRLVAGLGAGLGAGRCGPPGSWARRLRLMSLDSWCAWSRRSSSVASGQRAETPALRLSLVSGRMGGAVCSPVSLDCQGRSPLEKDGPPPAPGAPGIGSGVLCPGIE